MSETESREDSAAPGPGESPADEGAVAQKAGRGGLAIAGAKVYFIFVGLAQQIALKWVLGLGGYGALSSVLSVASITYNPIVTTSIQGVSRAVAQSPNEDQPAALNRTFWIHMVIASIAAAAFFAAAPTIAAWMQAPHITGGLRIISGVLFFYGMYTPLVGALNGQKRFVWQAGLDVTFATLRTVGLIAGGWWFMRSMGKGVEGANGGFVTAAALIFVFTLFVVGIGKRGPGGPSLKEHLLFIAPLLIGQTLLNLLLQADLTLLRKFTGEAALAAQLPVTEADTIVGAYRATQLFCFLPYQLLLSVTFVLFPMLATAYRDGDKKAVADYVRAGVRLALVLAGAMVSVTSGLSRGLLALIFGDDTAQLGAQSMQLLTLGFGAFAIFGIFIAVLNSLKREVASMILTGIAFALVVVLCFVFVRGSEFGPGLLMKTALSTSAGLAVATVSTGVLVKRTAGAVVPPLSVVRVVLAMGVAIAIGRALPYQGKVFTLVYAAGLGVVYLGLLVVTRELGKADVENIRAVVSRRKKKA